MYLMNWRFLCARLAAVMAMGSGCAADGANISDEENTGEVSQAELISIGSSSCNFPAERVDAVDAAKLLVIRHPSVVDDACRTQWTNPVGCNGLGQWTFWQLMENMRGSTPTTAEFVIKFLEQFRDTSAVNSFAMQDRSKIQSLIIDPWKRASGCTPGPWESSPCITLRKDLAPFRLLAIVNRMDLHAHQGAPSAYGGGGGEVRLVFGFLDATQYLDVNNNYIVGKMPQNLNKLKATVILEYGVVTDELNVNPRFWANQWWDLNSLNFAANATTFNNEFNNQLQFLTNYVTSPGLKPSQPNGSALNQIRTNEVDFDPADSTIGEVTQWELREHKLTCAAGPPCSDALLKRAPVALTPANSFGYDLNVNSKLDLPPTTLSDFLQDTTVGPQIDIENYDVPTTYNGLPFRGGSSRQGEFTFESQTWVTTAPPWSTTFFQGNATIRNRRHYFGLGTCNGCHYNETGTSQLHVANREFGISSDISPFLSVSHASSSSNYRSKDPITKIDVVYNEPRRRICEFFWVQDGNLTRLTTNGGRPH